MGALVSSLSLSPTGPLIRSSEPYLTYHKLVPVRHHLRVVRDLQHPRIQRDYPPIVRVNRVDLLSRCP